MMNSELMQRFQAAAETIRQRVGEAEIGVILGSGLGDYVDALQDAKYIDYKDIPGFPVSTAPGHAGRWWTGTLHGQRVCMMQGRFHYYEGYDLQDGGGMFGDRDPLLLYDLRQQRERPVLVLQQHDSGSGSSARSQRVVAHSECDIHMCSPILLSKYVGPVLTGGNAISVGADDSAGPGNVANSPEIFKKTLHSAGGQRRPPLRQPRKPSET